MRKLVFVSIATIALMTMASCQRVDNSATNERPADEMSPEEMAQMSANIVTNDLTPPVTEVAASSEESSEVASSESSSETSIDPFAYTPTSNSKTNHDYIATDKTTGCQYINVDDGNGGFVWKERMEPVPNTKSLRRQRCIEVK